MLHDVADKMLIDSHQKLALYKSFTDLLNCRTFSDNFAVNAVMLSCSDNFV